MSEALGRPEGRRRSVRERQCDPIPPRFVDVSDENAAEDRHGLPPRNAAQFKMPYVANLIMLRSGLERRMQAVVGGEFAT